MQYLILGANGYIGRYIYNRMKQDRISVVGTARNLKDVSELKRFDIQADEINNIADCIYDADKAAIVCIAISNIDKCFKEYENSYDINVTKTKKLIKELDSRGFYIIFFSSDNVFDGVKGNYSEDDVPNAINCYGKMKQEIEKYILEGDFSACVLRLSKVLSTGKQNQNILYDWEKQYEKNEIIHCIRNNRLSYIGIEDIYQACLIASKQKLTGIYNIVGNQSLTRKELAEMFFETMGAHNLKIEVQDMKEFNFLDMRPMNLGMSNLKFCRETGYCFTNIKKIIENYLRNM